MSKLIVLAPDVEMARAGVASLRAHGVSDEQLHTVAHEHTPLDDELPPAAIDETTDAVPALQRGAVVGGATGLLLGLTAAVVAPAGVVLAGGAAAAGALGGASFGAFASSLIGLSVPNSHLDEYQSAINDGAVLLIIELDESRIEPIKTVLMENHPALDIKGEQDLLPPAL